jgi:hypothetical protein
MDMRGGSRSLVAAVVLAATLSLGTGTAQASAADAGAMARAAGSGGCGTYGASADRPAGDGTGGCDGVPQPYGFLFGQNGGGSGLTTSDTGSSGGADDSDGGVAQTVLDALRELFAQL